MIKHRSSLARRLTLALFFASAAAGCSRNPVTGQTQLALISEGQEVQMGRQAAAEVEQSIGLLNNTALQNYVQQLGAGMAARSERPNLPWTFRVVDDPTPNAFALPGGPIYVTRGLLTMMNSEAELVSVLGHEIGHTTARHHVTMMSRQQLAKIGLGVGMIFSEQVRQFGDLAGAGMQLLFLRYGRDAEHQADDLGFRYALTGGWDVREMANVFATLQRAGELAGQSPLPQWASSHPFPEERIARTQQRVQALEQPLDQLTRNRAQFMQRISGLTYGADPRQGFFEGALFRHPELRFRMEFPAQWRTQNLTQAVVGVSGQQDAAIQLTLSDVGATEGLRRFLGQQGIQAGQTSQENINGIPAAIGSFRGQTEQGVMQGLVVYLTHLNRTYQLVAYTSAERYGQYDAAFRRALGSFAPETDQRVLNVQPNRLRMVQVPQAMTFQTFLQRYPSVVSPEEVALINGMTAQSNISAGTTMKQVVSGGS